MVWTQYNFHQSIISLYMTSGVCPPQNVHGSTNIVFVMVASDLFLDYFKHAFLCFEHIDNTSIENSLYNLKISMDIVQSLNLFPIADLITMTNWSCFSNVNSILLNCYCEYYQKVSFDWRKIKWSKEKMNLNCYCYYFLDLVVWFWMKNYWWLWKGQNRFHWSKLKFVEDGYCTGMKWHFNVFLFFHKFCLVIKRKPVVISLLTWLF